MPRAYIDRILSSNPSKRVWCLLRICGSKLPLRSRGVSTTISPNSPFTVLLVAPFRELPLLCPAGSCFSYPRWLVSSAFIARSNRAFVSRFNRPFSPMMSSGFSYPFSSSSTSSGLTFSMRSPLQLLRRTFTQKILHPTGLRSCRTMERLDRRIGQRRDATRAPIQARNGWRPSGRLLVTPPHHLSDGQILSNLWGPPHIADLQERAAFALRHGRHGPVIDDQHIHLAQRP